MRIGIMLRHLGKHGGGVVVYTRQLLHHLLQLNTSHEFVLMYQDAHQYGQFAGHERVREVSLSVPTPLLWDQVAVRWVMKKEQLDLVFNPKYSLPLHPSCPAVFVCHGLDWYVMPWGSKWHDRLSHRYLVPQYAREASFIVAVSDTARQHVLEYLGVQADRVQTIYSGVDDVFRTPIPASRREEVRDKYHLPEQFFMYCGQIYPPKNFARLLRAYAQVGPGLGIPLVIVGAHSYLCEHELGLIEHLQLSPWVIQPGWIEHDTLPVFYALATALLLPSLYEACPLPLLEAMASGCPIVTANRYGTRELAADAGILVDPDDIDSIAAGMREVATQSAERRQAQIAAGHQRAQSFTWERCARETLQVLERAAQDR